MRYYALLALGLLVTYSSTAAASNKLAWTEQTVSTLGIELIDPIAKEVLLFGPGGKVTVTWGTKTVYTNPWLDWKFVDGAVLIYEDGKVAEYLRPVRREGSILILQRHGKIARFKILRGNI
jgi:hypothetical protein